MRTHSIRAVAALVLCGASSGLLGNTPAEALTLAPGTDTSCWTGRQLIMGGGPNCSKQGEGSTELEELWRTCSSIKGCNGNDRHSEISGKTPKLRDWSPKTKESKANASIKPIGWHSYQYEPNSKFCHAYREWHKGGSRLMIIMPEDRQYDVECLGESVHSETCLPAVMRCDDTSYLARAGSAHGQYKPGSFFCHLYGSWKNNGQGKTRDFTKDDARYNSECLGVNNDVSPFIGL